MGSLMPGWDSHQAQHESPPDSPPDEKLGYFAKYERAKTLRHAHGAEAAAEAAVHAHHAAPEEPPGKASYDARSLATVSAPLSYAGALRPASPPRGLAAAAAGGHAPPKPLSSLARTSTGSKKQYTVTDWSSELASLREPGHHHHHGHHVHTEGGTEAHDHEAVLRSPTAPSGPWWRNMETGAMNARPEDEDKEAWTKGSFRPQFDLGGQSHLK